MIDLLIKSFRRLGGEVLKEDLKKVISKKNFEFEGVDEITPQEVSVVLTRSLYCLYEDLDKEIVERLSRGFDIIRVEGMAVSSSLELKNSFFNQKKRYYVVINLDTLLEDIKILKRIKENKQREMKFVDKVSKSLERIKDGSDGL